MSYSDSPPAVEVCPPYRFKDLATITNERELLEIIHRGNPDAFWYLWLKHSNKLFDRCLRWMKGNHAEAEDVHADCMMKAQNRMRQYAAEIRNVEAWLIRLVNNHCIDLHRQRKHTTPLGEDTGFKDVHTPLGLSPDNQVIHHQHIRSLVRFSNELGTNLRTPFILHIFYQQTYSEIAKKCDISEVNVRKRIQLARKSLREKMAQVEAGRIAPEKSNHLDKLLSVTRTCHAPEEFTQKGNHSFGVLSLHFDDPLFLNMHGYQSTVSEPVASVTSLEQYVQKHPRGWKKHRDLARAYELTGQGSKALDHYHLLQLKKPNNPRIVWQFAQLLELTGYRGHAADILQRLGEVAGDTGFVYLGKSHWLRQHWQQAECTLRKAVKHAPGDIFGRFQLSDFLFQTGCFNEALACLKNILHSHSDHLPAATLRLEILRQVETPYTFQMHVIEHLNQFPDHILAIKFLADLYIQSGLNAPILIEILEKIKHPARSSSFYLDSWCRYHIARGQPFKARKLLESFVERHEHGPAGWYRLAHFYFRHHSYDKAVYALSRANQLSKDLLLRQNMNQPEHFQALDRVLKKCPLNLAYSSFL